MERVYRICPYMGVPGTFTLECQRKKEGRDWQHVSSGISREKAKEIVQHAEGEILYYDPEKGDFVPESETDL